VSAPLEAELNVLTARERQVLELIAQGSATRILAGSWSELQTIGRHRERIMKQLDLHSRTELVKFAIRTGLISLE